MTKVDLWDQTAAGDQPPDLGRLVGRTTQDLLPLPCPSVALSPALYKL